MSQQLAANTPIIVSAIVAMSENRVIGVNNALPWHLPEDLRYFKKTTMGHPIVMGRKTFDSIGKPLPGRTNIVVTRQSQWFSPGVEACGNLSDALTKARECAIQGGANEVHIVGGAELYGQSLDVIQRFYVTKVHAVIEGDAYFPEFDFSAWQETRCEYHHATEQNPYDYSFVVLEKQ